MTTLNLTLEMERLIAAIVRQVEEFNHIDPDRIMVCVSTTRGDGAYGIYAKIHPLRFENGSRTTLVRRRRGTGLYEIPPITRQGMEILYLIYFLVPRFLNLPLREKLITVFHELYHVSPTFNGDIRRFPGKNFAHGSSRHKFNDLMAKLVGSFLNSKDNLKTVEFLEGDMAAIRSRHCVLVGRRMATPKLRIVGL
jgi:predicted metallopeptidase